MNFKILYFCFFLLVFSSCFKGKQEQVKTFDEYYTEAQLQNQGGDSLLALKLYSNAIAIDSSHAECYYNRGILNLNLGHDSAGYQDLCKTVELDKEFVPAYYTIGNILSGWGQIKESILYYDHAIQYDSLHFVAYFNAAVSLYKLKEYDKSLDYFEKYKKRIKHIRDNDNYPTANYYYGMIYLNKGNKELARRYLMLSVEDGDEDAKIELEKLK